MKKQLQLLCKSFGYAFKGLFYCIRTQRNFRIHTVVAFYVGVLSLFFSFTKLESIALALSIAMVLILELLNTAIEYIVDLLSPSYNEKAGAIKDIAAASVLVGASFSVVVGILLFSSASGWAMFFNALCTNILLIIALFISIFISLLYIFKK